MSAKYLLSVSDPVTFTDKTLSPKIIFYDLSSLRVKPITKIIKEYFRGFTYWFYYYLT